MNKMLKNFKIIHPNDIQFKENVNEFPLKEDTTVESYLVISAVNIAP